MIINTFSPKLGITQYRKRNNVTETGTKKIYQYSETTLTKMVKVVKASQEKIFSLASLLHHLVAFFNLRLTRATLSRQASITHAEKLDPSALTHSSICSINSWGKRIYFFADLLFTLPVTIFYNLILTLKCVHNSTRKANKKPLTYAHTLNYSGRTPINSLGVKKTTPRSAGTLSGGLTKPLKGVMIMANCYDTARSHIEQTSEPITLINKIKKAFADIKSLSYIKSVIAKSIAERDNSTTLKAHSTPLACFLLCDLHLPIIQLLNAVYHSMVTCSGQRLAVGCFPFEAVCHPVTRYRHNVTMKAVTLANQKETVDMTTNYTLLLPKESTPNIGRVLTNEMLLNLLTIGLLALISKGGKHE